jgi:hypothetical protein
VLRLVAATPTKSSGRIEGGHADVDLRATIPLTSNNGRRGRVRIARRELSLEADDRHQASKQCRNPPYRPQSVRSKGCGAVTQTTTGAVRARCTGAAV